MRAVRALCAEHRRAPFDRIQSIFSGSCSLVAVATARLLRVRSLVHVAGGELHFVMGVEPNTTWGAPAGARPYSVSGYGN